LPWTQQQVVAAPVAAAVVFVLLGRGTLRSCRNRVRRNGNALGARDFLFLLFHLDTIMSHVKRSNCVALSLHNFSPANRFFNSIRTLEGTLVTSACTGSEKQSTRKETLEICTEKNRCSRF